MSRSSMFTTTSMVLNNVKLRVIHKNVLGIAWLFHDLVLNGYPFVIGYHCYCPNVSIGVPFA